jgi:hypothetical protein
MGPFGNCILSGDTYERAKLTSLNSEIWVSSIWPTQVLIHKIHLVERIRRSADGCQAGTPRRTWSFTACIFAGALNEMAYASSYEHFSSWLACSGDPQLVQPTAKELTYLFPMFISRLLSYRFIWTQTNASDISFIYTKQFCGRGKFFWFGTYMVSLRALRCSTSNM